MTRIVALDVLDVRFPTSDGFHGSDAMNADPDYSAAYVILRTDAATHPEGHGLTFTIGRGTEIVTAACAALRPLVVGRKVDEVIGDLGGFARSLVRDSQLRWLGPEKGVVHLATAAVVNAAWDLAAKRAGLPLWALLTSMSPEQIVDLVDWRYLADALSPTEAIELLRRRLPGRDELRERLVDTGLRAYTTSAGWLGYDDETITTKVRAAVADGFHHVKLKVGADHDDDLRRVALVRRRLGSDRIIMLDANQAWDVPTAIERMRDFAEFRPWWIEEPTSPDDIAGHAVIARAVVPVQVASGEHIHNRVMFKQFLQAGALGICQLDACRLAGVNECVAVLLLAAKYGVPVCPHAGGVGLCEYVQHLAAFDAISVSGTTAGRVVEYVDHLHEHFVEPCVVERGRYRLPSAPGYSVEMRPESLEAYTFPAGSVWTERSTRT
ncbi:MAG: enolase C-terminal domain-like protein [Acidimicrobiia bacterium]